MALLKEMPPVAIDSSELRKFGKAWKTATEIRKAGKVVKKARSLSRTPPHSSAQLGQVFDRAIGKSLAEMLGGIPIASPHSSSLNKGHFVTAEFWSGFHLWVGIPTAILAAVAATSAFASWEIAAGVVSIVIAALSAVSTFLNPNEKAAAHLNAGNSYDALLSI